MSYPHVKLGSITDPINGKTIKSSDWVSTGIPIIRIQNLNGRNSQYNYLSAEIESKYMVNTGELLYSWSGTIGAFIWSGPRAALNQHIFRIPLDESRVNKRYLFHLLNFKTDKFRNLMQGSAGSLMHITKADFVNTLIPLPEKNIQDRLAERIDSLFDEIDSGTEELRKAKQKLELYKQSVLNAAIQGKLVPQDPNDEPASKLLERIRAEKERLIKEKKIKKEKPLPPISPDEVPFELPKGWEWSRIDNLIEVGRKCGYGVLQPGEDLAAGHYLVRVGDISDGKINLNGLKRISEEIYKKYSRTILKGGEILITVVGAIGRTAVVPQALAGANIARAVVQIPITTKYVNPYYLELYLRSPLINSIISGKAHEVARKTLNVEDIRKAIVALPPQQEQNLIVEFTNHALKDELQLEGILDAKLANVTMLKQSVLKSAFEGKLI